MEIAAVDDLIDLTRIATPICASSNFRFAWRFFRVTGINLGSPAQSDGNAGCVTVCDGLESNNVCQVYLRHFTDGPPTSDAPPLADQRLIP
jgi:hypothetical protein